MATTSSESPPTKKQNTETDYTLCIKCQRNYTNQQIRHEPMDSTYHNFLQCVRTRAEFGDSEHVSILARLGDVSAGDLKKRNAVWHVTCYSETTNKTNIQRARLRYGKALSQQDTSLLHKRKGRPSTSTTCSSYAKSSSSDVMCTRSKIQGYDKSACFFCQGEENGKLTMCQTANIGAQIAEIIHNCDNEMWKVNHSELIVIHDSDALSRDILYHKLCITRQWKRWQSKSSASNSRSSKIDSQQTLTFIAAEMQFYSQLDDRLQFGEFIPIDEAVIDYEHVMKEHNLVHIISRAALRTHITQHMKNVEFTRPQDRTKPSIIHSTTARDAAVHNAAIQISKDNVRVIFQCAQMIRRAIEKCKAWKFNGTLTDDYEGTPCELTILLKWIIQGHTTAQTEDRAQTIRHTCSNLAQQIVQAHKSKRQATYQTKTVAPFRNKTETPLTVGMSLYLYHATRSKKLIDLVSKAGVGVQYQQTIRHVDMIACAVQQNIEKNGVYIPPKLIKGRPLRAAIDNIDAKVDTPDGMLLLDPSFRKVFHLMMQPYMLLNP